MIDRLRGAAARATAAPARLGRQAVAGPVRRVDEATERAWELSLLRGSMPSAGEMTGILRRNGQPTFTQYSEAQRAGHYGARGFVTTDRAVVLDAIRARPAQAAAIVATADRLLAGTHEVFGSGPVDLRRGTRGAGHRVDWRRDPSSGERYGLVFSEWRWNVMGMRPGSADVKGPWEVTRAQHLTTVGQAYWLTGDERYARYFAASIADFIARNPPGLGVHWASNMDVALRVVGWLAALPFFQGAPALTHRWWRRFLRTLVVHGRHMVEHLEFGTLDGRIVTSNHYLSNLLGLHWLASCFPGLDAGVVWRGIAERGLELEIRTQLNDDGSDFESSVPYHRLVTEMFLSAWALSVRNGTPLSPEYRERLVRAVELVRALRQPGGRQPQIGDADDGRAHIFTDFGSWRTESMDHLLVAGAHVLGRPDLAADVADADRLEAAFWGEPAPVEAGAAPAPAQLFGDAGLAVLRQGPSYLLLANGPVGTAGFGNHKHNDQLAIEWVVDDQPLLVDAGSYTYSQDPDARNRFRSTAVHNTVMVDGVEQHTVNPEWLFRTFAEGEVELDLVLGEDAIGATGRHTAYARLDPPLTHGRRTAVLRDGTVAVEDRFDGAAGHELRWQLLLHPDVDAEVEGPRVRLRGPSGSGSIWSEDLTFVLEDAWYSPGYGRRTRATSLVATRSDGPDRVQLALLPDSSGTPAAQVLASAETFWGSR